MATNRQYFCTCKIKHKFSSGYDDCRHLNFHPTKVDKDEICIYCGHYAWEKPKHILFPRTSTVPWREEVKAASDKAWAFNPDLKRAYYEKTYYSDYELDNGEFFEQNAGFKELRERGIDDDLSGCFIGWGGNSGENYRKEST